MVIKTYYIYLFFLFIFTSIFVIYFPAFGSYFFQDDWYSLSISQASNLSDFIKFFIPNTNVVYFRPLGMQLPFFLLNSIFGLNPVAFRLLTFLTHFLNTFLVFIIIKKIFKIQSLSLFSAFFYGVSAVNYIPFYWSATYAFILGPTFFLLSSIQFLNFLNKTSQIKFIYSLIFFLLGILTFETIIVFPLIAFFYLLLFKKLKNLSYLLPFLSLSAVFLIFRVIYFPPPQIHDYQIAINMQTLHNLKYYFLWSLNWPEEMKNQFTSFFIINSDFIKNFKIYYFVYLISLLLNILLLLIIPLILLKLNKIKTDLLYSLFGILWYLISLLPVIFFPNHTFAYYLPISLIGFCIFCSSLYKPLLSTIRPGILSVFAILLLINWFISSFFVFDLNRKIHWAPRRANISKSIITKAKKHSLPQDLAPVFLVSASDEVRYSLNGQDALRIIFNNPKVDTIYTNETVNGIRL